MHQEWNAEEMGQEIGLASTEHLLETTEKVCSHEEKRIELVNQARRCALEKQYQDLVVVETNLLDRLRHAPRPCDLKCRRRSALYYSVVAGVLTLAGFILTILTFDPYRLGWKSYIFCIGIAVVTPFLVEKVIEHWDSARLIKSFAAIACLAALTSLVLLAEIRGDLLTEQIKGASSTVVLDDNDPPPAQPENSTFYDRTLALLRLALASLAVAMELGAGLALREARRLAVDSLNDASSLQRELMQVQQTMADLIVQIVTLRNEPQVFAEQFWRNFYTVMLTHATRSAAKKLFRSGLLALVLLPVCASAQRCPVSLVVAVDLSQSVAAKDGNKESEFKKNLDAVPKLIAELPSGSRVTVIGITDRSFAQPLILLVGHVPDDPGYFGEHLRKARYLLTKSWQQRSVTLTPHFRETDVLGAVLVAEQIFRSNDIGYEKVLVILSDMRQHTAEVDLESGRHVPDFERIETEKEIMIPSLKTVDVYVLGVDGAGKPVVYWKSLRTFWAAYFQETGARLLDYSVLREVPNFRESRSARVFAPLGLPCKPIPFFVRWLPPEKQAT